MMQRRQIELGGLLSRPAAGLCRLTGLRLRGAARRQIIVDIQGVQIQIESVVRIAEIADIDRTAQSALVELGRDLLEVDDMRAAFELGVEARGGQR